MSLSVRSTDARVINLRTRMPFRYGIAAMTQAPHFLLEAQVEIDGRIAFGRAADQLPPKWFTKNPTSAIADDLVEMLDVIAHAREAAVALAPKESVFDFWQALYAAQKSWAGDRYPPLLWNFGVTLLERAVIDAFCRAQGVCYFEAVQSNALGIRLGDIFPELAGLEPRDLLPEKPLESLIVRHTVGLSDPLTDADIDPAERAHDGLPQSLEAYLRRDGITHLKIKLSGNADRDRARLRAIAALLEACGTNYAYTLDGNENFHTVEPFRELWRSLAADGALADFLSRLIFVEQPIHRDAALAPETCAALRAWTDRPPIIIDESDSTLGVLATALEGGYVGTSHKNCKGVFKGLANACLVRRRLQQHPDGRFQMSAEDLTNVGPIALLEDLAAIATLGIPHAERNGHHYFAGLAQFPHEVQEAVLAAHPDLYRQHEAGYPVIRVEGGRVALGSAVAAPFGHAANFDLERFTPLESWRIDSLGNAPTS